MAILPQGFGGPVGMNDLVLPGAPQYGAEKDPNPNSQNGWCDSCFGNIPGTSFSVITNIPYNPAGVGNYCIEYRIAENASGGMASGALYLGFISMQMVAAGTIDLFPRFMDLAAPLTSVSWQNYNGMVVITIVFTGSLGGWASFRAIGGSSLDDGSRIGRPFNTNFLMDWRIAPNLGNNGTGSFRAGQVNVGTGTVNAGNAVFSAGVTCTTLGMTGALTGATSIACTSLSCGGGAITSAILSAALITSGLLATARGGFNLDVSGIAKGGLVVGSAAGTFAIKTIGSDTQVLTADAASAGGMKWTAPAAPAASCCQVYKSSDQSPSASTWTTATFDSETLDTDAYHDNVTNNSRLTVPTTAKYLLYAVVVGAYNNSASLETQFYKNGSALGSSGPVSYVDNASSGTKIYTTTLTCIVDATAADFFEFFVDQQGTVVIKGYSSNSYNTIFGIVRLG